MEFEPVPWTLVLVEGVAHRDELVAGLLANGFWAELVEEEHVEVRRKVEALVVGGYTGCGR